MNKLGHRVRLKGTHIAGDIQHQETVNGVVMCIVWWDAAPHPDTGWTQRDELESAERLPGGMDSALYDPYPISKTDHLQSDRKWREGHTRS
jgi:hypothetical protein